MKLKEEVEEIEREVYDYSLFLLVTTLLVIVFGFAYFLITHSRNVVREARRATYGRNRKA